MVNQTGSVKLNMPPQDQNLRFGLSKGSFLRIPSEKLTTLNARTGRKLGSTFEQVINQFVFFFLFMDFIGIWVPRIGVSLKRGRIPYNVEEDPQAKHLKLYQKNMLSLKKNVQGLNWPNFFEEAGREFCTGPGMLLIPTLAFALARHRSTALELSHKQLRGYTEGFADHLNTVTAPSHLETLSGLTSQTYDSAADKLLKSELRQYMMGLISDQTMKQTPLDSNARDALRRIIQSSYEQSPDMQARALEALDHPNGTIGDYLNNWFERWLDVRMGQRSKGEQRKLFKALNLEFKSVVMEGYNKGPRLAVDLENLSGDMLTTVNHKRTSLMRADQIETRVGEMHILDFVESLKRWVDLPMKTVRKAKPNVAGSFTENLLKLGQKTMRNKGLITFATVVSTGAYLASLAFRLQSHDSYPGERLAHQPSKLRQHLLHPNARHPKPSQPSSQPMQPSQPARPFNPAQPFNPSRPAQRVRSVHYNPHPNARHPKPSQPSSQPMRPSQPIWPVSSAPYNPFVMAGVQ